MKNKALAKCDGIDCNKHPKEKFYWEIDTEEGVQSLWLCKECFNRIVDIKKTYQPVVVINALTSRGHTSVNKKNNRYGGVFDAFR